MHPVKRRKLDVANSTLAKPFRSPLRTSANNTASQAGETNERRPKQHHTDSATALTPHQLRSSTAYEGNTPLPPSPIVTTKQQDAALGNIDALQTEYSALARKMTSLRQSLDTAQQALQIETTDKSSDINSLIVKWRSVVQDSAEELFEDAKQRVEKEGGVQSWLKQQEKEPPDLWFEERRFKLTDAQRRMLDVQQKEDRAEAEKYGLNEKHDVEEEAEIVSSALHQFPLSPLMHPYRVSRWTRCCSS